MSGALAPDDPSAGGLIDIRWQNDGLVVITLPGPPTADDCHQLHQRLNGRVAAGSEVVLRLLHGPAPGTPLGLPTLAGLVQLARFVRAGGARLHLEASRAVADEVAASGLWRMLPVRVV